MQLEPKLSKSEDHIFGLKILKYFFVKIFYKPSLPIYNKISNFTISMPAPAWIVPFPIELIDIAGLLIIKESSIFWSKSMQIVANFDWKSMMNH
jgi:hypothetical protein